MAKVVNIHQRELPASVREVGALIDTLSSDDDRLWPADAWPPMLMDRPLAIGASGGHGPVRYFVESYSQGSKIRFRFTGPRGFDGFHALQVVRGLLGQTVLQHTLRMETHGLARLTWPLFYRPLHDALVEDALDRAERSLGGKPKRRRYSPWVWFLRTLYFGAPSKR